MKKVEEIVRELEEVKKECERNRNGIDATSIQVKFSKENWRLAKLNNVKKSSDGYVIFSGSVNSNGTAFMIAANKIAADNKLVCVCKDV